MNRFTASFFKNNLKPIAVLILVPALLYLKSLFYDFSPMDEQWLIVKNTKYLQNPENFIELFKLSVTKLYYRPLLIGSFMLDSIVGKSGPFVFHLSNLIFHLLCVLSLYKLLVLLKTEAKFAFFLSLLFAVHPALLHAVAWIPGRNDSMLCLFSLLSFIFLINYFTKNKIHFFFLHLVSFITAMFIKENAVLLPILFTILFFNYYKVGKKIIFLSLIWLIIGLCWYYLKTSIVPYKLSAGTNVMLSIKQFVHGLFVFTGKSLLPLQQSVSPTFTNSSFITGMLCTLVLIYLYFKIGVANKTVALFGLALFLILLAIPAWYGAVSPLGEQYEHRAYTSVIGLLLFISQLNFNIQSKSFKYVFSLLVLFFALKTFVRMDVYKDRVSYLDEGMKDCPQNYIFYYEKANVFYYKKEYSSALNLLNTAIQLQPKKKHLLANRASVYAELGKKNECIADFNAALKISGFDPYLCLSRCVAFNRFGDMTGAMRDLEELKIKSPKQIPPGLEKDITQRYDMAVWDDLNAKIQFDPNKAKLYIDRAKFYLRKRKGHEALADLKRACELEPGNKEFKAYYDELDRSFPR